MQKTENRNYSRQLVPFKRHGKKGVNLVWRLQIRAISMDLNAFNWKRNRNNGSKSIQATITAEPDLPPETKMALVEMITKATDLVKTFELVDDPDTGKLTGIKCLVCQKTSWNMNDVMNLYCGQCHRFHHPHQGA